MIRGISKTIIIGVKSTNNGISQQIFSKIEFFHFFSKTKLKYITTSAPSDMVLVFYDYFLS